MRSVSLSLVATLAAGLVPAAPALAQRRPVPIEIIERYIDALGGLPAVLAIDSRSISARVVTPSDTFPLEILQAAPDRFVRSVDSTGGSTRMGHDGRRAWTATAREVREFEEHEIADLRREFALHFPFSMIAEYRAWNVDTGTVNGRLQFGLRDPTMGRTGTVLWFDRETRLLTGWDLRVAGATVTTRLEDWREVDGVKVPFRVSRSRAGVSWSEEITLLVNNVRVEQRRFRRP